MIPLLLLHQLELDSAEKKKRMKDRNSNVRKLGVGHLKLAALPTLVCPLMVQEVCSGPHHHICRAGRKRKEEGRAWPFLHRHFQEVVHYTSVLCLIGPNVSPGHTCLQGRLGNGVPILGVHTYSVKNQEEEAPGIGRDN